MGRKLDLETLKSLSALFLFEQGVLIYSLSPPGTGERGK
jgi:hypothetical protein